MWSTKICKVCAECIEEWRESWDILNSEKYQIAKESFLYFCSSNCFG